MKQSGHFRLLAALILLPVLVLTVLAGIGLRERRIALRAEAQALCNARSFAREWVAALDAAAGASPKVVFYDDPPMPRSDGPETGYMEEIERADTAALRARMLSVSSNPQFVSSGLPLRAIAGWRWFQLALKEDPLRDDGEHAGRESAFLHDTENLMRVVLAEAPSVLSPMIVERVAERFPQAAPEWRMDWWRNEVRRIVLRLAAPVYAPGKFAPLQVLVMPRTDHVLTGLDEETGGKRMLNDAPSAGLLEAPGTVAMIFPRIPGEARVLLESELRAAFRVMQEKTRDLRPAWAAVNVRMKPGSLAHFGGLPLRLASLGEEITDVLSREDMGFCFLETGPREKDWLLRDYYRLMRWVGVLIGTALLTAVAGLWLVRRTLERERKLGEMKSQFVSSVSHELRAPVGSMRLMAEALASGKVSGPPADEFHRLMASEGARLSGLIENVLDFARIEQGRKRYAFAETDVSALAQDAVKLMKPQAEERGQKILTDFHPLAFGPQVDAPALQQALINLLENALKFSPPDTEVSVALSDDPSRNTWSLSVTDHGPGIPKNEHARIFERFYRPGDELRRETAGTGIGLAIVKHVVEGHGGRVVLNSEPGKGSVFTMEFPKSPA